MTTSEMTAQQKAAQRLSERMGKPANLWLDAWHRLIRNRAALIGGILLILLLLTSILAPLLAPFSYSGGDSLEAYTVPRWLIKLCPAVSAPTPRFRTSSSSGLTTWAVTS